MRKHATTTHTHARRRQTTADHTTLLAALLAAFPRHFEMIFWPYGMYDAMYHTSAHHWRNTVKSTRMAGAPLRGTGGG